MLGWILDILNAGGTGVLATLVVGLEAYLRDHQSAKEQATIQDYLEWLRREEHQELLQSQQVLVNKLEEGGEQNEVLQFHLNRILQTVQEVGCDLSEIRRQLDRIPDVDRKLDLLIARLPNATPNQVMIDAKVLDLLASGLRGSGIRVALKGPQNLHEEGTLMVAWRFGTKSPELMLADCVGGIHENRLSLILNQDASLSLRAYDGSGSSAEIRSPSHASREYLIGFAVWQGRDLSLWTNDIHDGSVRIDSPFQRLGPTVLFGIDIEGVLSAHGARMSTGAMKMGMSYFLDHNGFNLQKDGIWHGSRYDAQSIWARALDAHSVHELSLNPFVLLQRTGDCEGSLRRLTAAIRDEPNDPTLHIARGITFTWKDDFVRAAMDYNEAIRIAPSLVDPYLFCGVANNILGNLEEALVNYRRAIAIDPRNADVHNRLAWLFASSPDRAFRCAEDALLHAREAHSLCPWRPDILDTLAASYAEDGDFASAVKWQETALAACLEKRNARFGARLTLYEESLPFRDDSWISLKQVWRHAQRLG